MTKPYFPKENTVYCEKCGTPKVLLTYKPSNGKRLAPIWLCPYCNKRSVS